MTTHSVLEPLIAAGLIARLRTDGRLSVYPEQAITPALDAHIRTHRDELIAALSEPWPAEPGWWAAWVDRDDRQRAETIARAKARLELRRNK